MKLPMCYGSREAVDMSRQAMVLDATDVAPQAKVDVFLWRIRIQLSEVVVSAEGAPQNEYDRMTRPTETRIEGIRALVLDV